MTIREVARYTDHNGTEFRTRAAAAISIAVGFCRACVRKREIATTSGRIGFDRMHDQERDIWHILESMDNSQRRELIQHILTIIAEDQE